MSNERRPVQINVETVPRAGADEESLGGEGGRGLLEIPSVKSAKFSDDLELPAGSGLFTYFEAPIIYGLLSPTKNITV